MNENLNISPSIIKSNPTNFNFKFTNGSTKTAIPANYGIALMKLTTTEFNNGNFTLSARGGVIVPYTGIIYCVAYTYQAATDAPTGSFWRSMAIKNITQTGTTNIVDGAVSQNLTGGSHMSTMCILEVVENDEIGVLCYSNAASSMTTTKLSGFYVTVS